MMTGKKLRKANSGRASLIHWCPGCDSSHQVPIEGNSPVWSFDGNYDRPTFGPSIRVFITETTDDNDKPLPAPIDITLCHYFIKAGRIEYCGDSPHKYAGQTIDLPDWPYAPGTYGGIEE